MKVLVYQVGLLGDTLVSIPSYRAVRRHFGKDAHITVVHNEGHGRGTTAQQILKGTELADDFISFPQSDGRSTLMTAVTLFPKVAARRFDIAVYIGPSERTPHIIRRHQGFFRLCGIRRFIGFHAYDHAIFEERDTAGLLLPVRHESELLLERLTSDGIDPDNANDFAEPFIVAHDADDADDWLRRQRREERRLVAIGPGGNQPAKHWDLDRFVEIGRRLHNAGCELLVIGTQQERGAADTLLDGWGSGIDAVGQFSIAGTARLLSRCDFLVGLDT